MSEDKENSRIYGYKAMTWDMTCKDFRFELGQEYKEEELKMCSSGFHFCQNIDDCFSYYPYGSRICEVEALGETLTEGDKSVTDHIRIVRELSHAEIVKKSRKIVSIGADGCWTMFNGDREWLVNGKRHRPTKEGPAVEWEEGDKEWWENDKRHRPTEEGPAVEWVNGGREWWVHGAPHRPTLEGPAIIRRSGTNEWWLNGKRHRPSSEGPAVIQSNGHKEWFENGLLHRPVHEGPAVEYPNGYKEWFEHGKEVLAHSY